MVQIYVLYCQRNYRPRHFVPAAVEGIPDEVFHPPILHSGKGSFRLVPKMKLSYRPALSCVARQLQIWLSITTILQAYTRKRVEISSSVSPTLRRTSSPYPPNALLSPQLRTRKQFIREHSRRSLLSLPIVTFVLFFSLALFLQPHTHTTVRVNSLFCIQDKNSFFIFSLCFVISPRFFVFRYNLRGSWVTHCDSYRKATEAERVVPAPRPNAIRQHHKF